MIRNPDLHRELCLCNGTDFDIPFISAMYKYCCPGKRLNDYYNSGLLHSGTFA